MSVTTNDPESPFILNFNGLARVPVDGQEDLCLALDLFIPQFELLRIDFGLSSDDVDDDGIPDPFSLALIEAQACPESPKGLTDPTRDAYMLNVLTLEQEADAFAIQPYLEVLAALFTISDETVAAYVELIMSIANLELDYVSVRCIDGVCTPAKSADTAYLVFDAQAKGPAEPYSGVADLDADGTVNVQEFLHVTARGGNEADYAAAASDPLSDGTLLENRGGCSALGDGGRTGGDWIVVVAAAGLLGGMGVRRRCVRGGGMG
jgi:hypothetical protein